MSLGQRIRRLRQTRGLTQSQLGGVELSKSFISLLEKDRAQPSLDTLVLLAGRLRTSVDSLLGQDGHLHEMVGEGLLALSEDAIRGRQFDTALKLLEPLRFLTSTYALEEQSREADLLEAQVVLQQGRYDDAWAMAGQVRAASEQAHDSWRAGRAGVIMAWTKIRTRDFPTARSVLERALAALRTAKAGRDPARVEALIALGTTLGNLGDLPGALRRYQEAARSAVARQNLSLRGQALWGIGLCHRKMGQYALAAESLLRAKETFEAAEELPDLMRVLHNLGQLLVAQGQSREGLRHFHHALRVMDRLGKRHDRVATMTEIGRVHFTQGSLDEAAHFAGRALDEAREINDPVGVAEAEVIVARVVQEQGDLQTAVRLFKDALAIFQQRQMRGRVAELARELGLLLRERGAHAQAATYLAVALQEEGKEVSPASE